MKDSSHRIKQVFGPIGITMSGGGSRAAAFHLGTLEYLHRLGLLKDVEVISSASGGSFVAAKYACMLSEELKETPVSRDEDEEAYDDFFNDFFNLFFEESYRHLRDTQAIKKVVESVGDKRPTDSCNYNIPSGRYALINIAADLYAETFLKSGKGTPYLLGEILDPPEKGYPLRHVILNATDYHRGVAFRFSSNPGTYIGNVYLYQKGEGQGDFSELSGLIREECKVIRVADIVAASSCLPPLFEPMGFPDDFAWPDGEIPVTVRKLCSYRISEKKEVQTPVPLMDGGLYDNQAIESVMLADRNLTLKGLNELLLAGKWGEETPRSSSGGSEPDSQLGMFIVSDAQKKGVDDGRYDFNYMRNNYLVTIRGKMSRFFYIIAGRLRLSHVIAGMALFLFSLTFVVICDIWESIEKFKNPDFASLLHFSAQLISVAGVVFFFVIAGLLGIKIWKASENIPQVGRTAWSGFFRIRFQWLMQAVCFRLSSTLSTIFDVLLKRTRDLGYFTFYGDRFYHKKRVSNLLYRLTPGEQTEESKTDEEWLKVKDLFTPSIRLQEYVQHANNVGTRFWFNERKPWEQPCLVCAGQATICFSLAQYIVRNHGGDFEDYPGDIKKIWNSLVTDWDSLNKHPYSLLRKRVGKLKQKAPGSDRVITCIEPNVREKPQRRRRLIRALQLSKRRR